MNAPKLDPFESRLTRQVLRRPPADLKSDVLAASARAQTSLVDAPQGSRPDGFFAQVAAILWPSPIAWGTLAAVWLALIAFKAASPGAQPLAARSSRPNFAIQIYAFREQNLLVRELLGPAETTRPPERRRQEPMPAAPRSERQKPVAAV